MRRVRLLCLLFFIAIINCYGAGLLLFPRAERPGLGSLGCDGDWRGSLDICEIGLGEEGMVLGVWLQHKIVIHDYDCAKSYFEVQGLTSYAIDLDTGEWVWKSLGGYEVRMGKANEVSVAMKRDQLVEYFPSLEDRKWTERRAAGVVMCATERFEQVVVISNGRALLYEHGTLRGISLGEGICFDVKTEGMMMTEIRNAQRVVVTCRWFDDGRLRAIECPAWRLELQYEQSGGLTRIVRNGRAETTIHYEYDLVKRIDYRAGESTILEWAMAENYRQGEWTALLPWILRRVNDVRYSFRVSQQTAFLLETAPNGRTARTVWTFSMPKAEPVAGRAIKTSLKWVRLR